VTAAARVPDSGIRVSQVRLLDADQRQPSGTITSRIAVPPSAASDDLVVVSVGAQLPSWVMVNDFPPIVADVVRVYLPVYGFTVTATVEAPVPELGDGRTQ